ncbi:Uncharacterised protein [uncultured archaeon]|nr:Uncharacterised protein [uncultured archaeon]
MRMSLTLLSMNAVVIRLREIVAKDITAERPRIDAVFYLLDAMWLFWGESLEEIREITFEIGMLGQYGLDINDPKETHVLRALPGRTLSALQLVCIMYAGFKRIEPGMDIGVDLGEEWGMVLDSLGHFAASADPVALEGAEDGPEAAFLRLEAALQGLVVSSIDYFRKTY